MTEELTKQQRQAVENRGGRLLVSAAAGSGKTKVLVDRLMGYLTDPADPANLDDFLIITYTNAAAAELRGKIAAKLTERIAADPENKHLLGQLQRLFLTKISTVHGFCGDILREYAYRLDLAADFRVADENECREIRETVLSDLLEKAYADGDDPDFQAFVDTQGVGRDDRMVAELIAQVYDSARCHLDPEGWLDKCLAMVEADGVRDGADTRWGRFLMEDLGEYLSCQCAVLTRCLRWAEGYRELEKTAAVLADALSQLRRLESQTTWDGIVALGCPKFLTLTFPTKKNPDLETTQRVKAAWKACKEGLKKKFRSFDNDSAQILEDLAQSRAAARGLTALVRRFDRDYSAAKRRRRVLDFSDLEHRALDLLLGRSRSGPTAVAQELSRRYREILVDEYQDSNGVQDAIFDALTRQKHNCFLVGDVKQSIYQFRLADPEIFLKKYHKYLPATEAAPGEGRKIHLSDNFRSGGEVIEAVNHVFSTCMREAVGGLDYGPQESLKEGTPHPPLPDPAVELAVLEGNGRTYETEAAYVAGRIAEMLKSGTLVRGKEGLRPVQPEDIVLLMRSPGTCGGPFRQALEARGIRCASGGGGDLLETPEISVFRALLQVIRNPRQDIPLLSLLASPVLGFTAEDLALLRSGQKWGCFYDALAASNLPKARDFLEKLTLLRREARMRGLSALLELCLSLTRLDSVYAAMEDGTTKSANIRTFFQLAAAFEKTGPRDLGQFLDHLEALEGKGLLAAAGSAGGCVTIMSIHKSKGLEFPVVFVCCLAHRFNTENQRATILCDKDLGLGLSVADPENRVRYPSIAKRAIAAKMRRESVSEEMRVLYVALTRARDRLILCYTDNRPDKRLAELSDRMDFDGGDLLCREAGCPGQWVLLAALRRTESGVLRQFGSTIENTVTGDFPWRISMPEVTPEAVSPQDSPLRRPLLPETEKEALSRSLRQKYPYLAATQAPSKQTATDLKGRFKDEEAAQDTAPPRKSQRTWREPSFLGGGPQGKTVGSAIHAALQYIRYEACCDEKGVERELDRLESEGFLTPEQRKLVPAGKLARLFETDLGRKLRTGNCLREFKFSILEDGSLYDPELAGEQVLLQGVVDCALIEPEGITVIDYKTDRATRETVPQLTARYRPQVQTYARALSKIYQSPIKAQYLYLFALDEFVAL